MGREVRRISVLLVAYGLLLLSNACGTRMPPPPPVSTKGDSPSSTTGSVVNVSDLGARGDGQSDDRPAIQAALDRAHALGGAEVVFPAGRFLLSSATAPGDRLLNTFPNQHLRGAGRAKTTIVVSPAVGDYVTAIGASSDSTAIQSWSLRGVTVDQSASNGAELNVPQMNLVPRMAIRLGDYQDGSSVRVTDSAFVDSDNVNTLYLFAESVEISRNSFTKVGGPVGTRTHDHSTVYVTSTVEDGTQRIISNTFAGVRGSGGAQTAIETHGARQDVSDNTITDYLRGMNITGVASVPATSASVRANRLEGVAIGVQLWSELVPGPVTRNGLEAVELDDNRMTLDGRIWDQLPEIEVPTSAVLVNPTNTAPVNRVRVTDNVLRYLSTGASAGSAASYTAAVSCRTSSLPNAVGVLEAHGNQSFGAPVWIDETCPDADGLVRDNEVR